MSNAIARRIETIQKSGAFKGSDLAKMLDVRPETISRWNQGKASPRALVEQQLLTLEYLVEELADVYEPAETRMFFYAPQRLLDGERPVDLFSRGESARVQELVRQIRDSVHI
jgi:transcriptional regulator with XRE-family HTH domain